MKNLASNGDGKQESAILIKLKQVSYYGLKRYNPVCDTSKLIISLMGKRATFTPADFVKFVRAGWKVEVVHD